MVVLIFGQERGRLGVFVLVLEVSPVGLWAVGVRWLHLPHSAMFGNKFMRFRAR